MGTLLEQGDTYISSHIKIETGYGDTASTQSPSLLPGQKIKRTKIAQSIVAADGSVSADPGTWQTRKISAAATKASPSMHSPSKVTDKVPAPPRNVASVPTTLLTRRR